MSSIQGNPIAVLVRTEIGFDAQSGRFVQYVWEGTQDAITAAAAGLIGATSYMQSPSGAGKWQLTARFGETAIEGGQEVPVREERLRFNITQKSIYSHPDLTAGLTKAQINLVRKWAESNEELTFSFPTTEQTKLYNLAIAGVDSYPVYQPIVIVTDTASYGYEWSAEFANYGLTFDTNSMIQDAGLISGWSNNLPQDTSELEGFVYGWLKKPPEIVSVGGNRTQLVQEYEYGLWADDLLPRP